MRPDKALLDRLTDPSHAHPHLASAVATVRESVRLRRPSRVEISGGYWIHRTSGTALVTRGYWSVSPEENDAIVVEELCYGFQIEPGDVVVDVGAGVGEVTRPMAHAVGPTGKVIAIEAQPQTLGALEMMLRLNGIENVDVVGAAVMAAPGVVAISDGEHWEANSLFGEAEGIEVPATTLDQIVLERGLERIALLKVNIEGAEVEALRGMTQTLTRCDRVVVECHDFLATEPDDPMRTMSPVRALLEDRGFSVTTRPDHPSPAIRATLYAFASTPGSRPPALSQ